MPRNEIDQPQMLPAAASDGNPGSRKRYTAPSLMALGDLRTFTLGGSPGVTDSGPNFGNQKPPGAP